MNRTAGRLLALLEAERRAIMSGEFGALSGQASQKEELFDSIAAEIAPDPRRLHLLAARVKRNQELLQAAMAGVRDVQLRMAELNAAQSTLNTYDRTGQPSQISRHHGKLEHKA